MNLLKHFLVASVFTAAVAAPALADPSVTFSYIYNVGSKVKMDFTTFTTSYSFPDEIAAYQTGTGWASAPGATSLSGSVQFRSGGGTGPGCSFQTTIIKNGVTGLYSFSNTASKVPAGAAVTCTYTWTSTNTTTGAAVATLEMTGH